MSGNRTIDARDIRRTDASEFLRQPRRRTQPDRDRLTVQISSITRRLFDRMRVLPYRLRGWPVPHALRYRLLEDVNRRAYLAYRPGAFAGGVHLFVAADDPSRDAAADPTLGWSGIVGERVRMDAVPGTHHTLIEQPALAEALTAALSTLSDPAPENTR